MVYSESEFKYNMKKIFRLKNVAMFGLIALFIWWGGNAAIRYWSQPLTTDISNSFGDNPNGIEFPLITLCQPGFSFNNPLMKDCEDGSWDFISSFESCLKNDKNFNIDSFMESLQTEISNIVEGAYIWTGSEYLSLSTGNIHI
jgi:hypothetical protein